MATLGRAGIVWPDLGTAGGVSLETAVHGAVTNISNNSIARYVSGITLANTAFTSYTHSFNLPSEDLEIVFYDTTTRKRLTLDSGDNDLVISYTNNNTIQITNNGALITFDMLIVAISSLRSIGQVKNYIETTNATPTTILSRAIQSDSGEILTALVNGYNPTTGNGASFELKYKVKNNAGTLTLSLIEKTSDKDVASWDANLSINGTSIDVDVTGEVGTIGWNCVLSNTKL